MTNGLFYGTVAKLIYFNINYYFFGRICAIIIWLLNIIFFNNQLFKNLYCSFTFKFFKYSQNQNSRQLIEFFEKIICLNNLLENLIYW